MSRTIRVSLTTYNRLLALMVVRDTFDDVVSRIIDYYNTPLTPQRKEDHARDTMEAERTKDRRAARRD